MTIAPSQPVRSANPGIVPPWLQGIGVPLPGTAAPTPATPAAPAPAPTAPTSAAVSAAKLGQSQLTRDAIGFIPMPNGDVVVVDVPDAPTSTHTRSFQGSQLGGQQFDMRREQQRVEDTVKEVQAKYAQLGVRPEEGNDHVVARFDPQLDNAFYSPKAIPEMGVPADSITVGVDPRDGTPFAVAEDVVAHELGHRLIDHMTSHGKLSLLPTSEDVAIHESLADTFASMVDDDDWVIGDKLSEPVRIMNHPEQLGHPGKVSDLKKVLAPGSEFMHPIELRDGDVARDERTGEPIMVPDWHVVAGIPNKAASIIGDELGRDAMSKIYFKAVREDLRPGKEIEGLAVAVMQSAKDLYGADSHEFQVTEKAWDQVGVLDLVKDQVAALKR
jgi:hypothetical protein